MISRDLMRRILGFFLYLSAALHAANYQAGAARVNITPSGPIRLSGYAARTHPSEGVAQDLWAKALALEDGRGGRAVLVTTDLIGLPRSVSDVIAARALKEYKLERSQLLLNSSHTHSGPVVKPNLSTMYDFPPDQEKVVTDYTNKLTDQLVALIGDALKSLAPARIVYGVGSAEFAANRRQATEKGVKIGVNAGGAVDHSVPVLQALGTDGKLKAILFGYSCHNTTLTGEFYQVSGDYAGAAQAELERAHPGAVAMFLMLTGGDQNPNPRSSPELAVRHGKELAEAVDKVIAAPGELVNLRIRSAYQTADLPLMPHTRADFEKMAQDSNVYKVRLAKMMLRAYDEGHPPRTVTYPVQAIRLSKDVVVLGMGGEVVVGYGLRAKQAYPKAKMMVAGYSNDVMCYIPTRKILGEGGYEAVDSMVYYGQPTTFTPEVEERIFDLIGRVMKRVGYKATSATPRSS